MRIILLLLTIIAAHPSFAEVIYFKPYEGVPKYDIESPFKKQKSKLSQLMEHLALLKVKDECIIGEIKENFAKYSLKSNICTLDEITKTRKLISSIAPSFEKNKITFWVENTDAGPERELLIGYVDISSNKHFKYPYLSLI